LDLRKYNSLFLSLFALLLFFPGLGSRDLWAPVEPRYAEIVRVMFANDEWIVPSVNGDIYTDKPIFYFWIALLAAKLTGGVTEWAVRIPAALGGLGFVLATYWIGRELFNARIGTIAAIVLATSMRIIWEARWAHVDMLFGCFFLLSIYFGVRAVLRRARRYEVLLAYAFMALATLTKGLIGMVLPGLIFVALVVAQRDWSMIRAVKPVAGLLVYLMIAAPWFYFVSRATEGRWLADFIEIHHLERYTAGAGHRQPFFYYFKTLPADFLPWTTFLIPALFEYRNYRRLWTDPVLRFCLLWFATVFIFFTLSDTKRDLYLIPLLPTLAFVVAHYSNDLEQRQISFSRFYFWLTIVFFGTLAAAALALPVAAFVARPDAMRSLLPPCAVLAVGGITTIALIVRRRPIATTLCVSVVMVLLTGTLTVWLFPYLEAFKSRRPFAAVVNQNVPATAQVYVYDDIMHDFNFYTRRTTIPALDSPEQVLALRERRGTSYVLIKESDLKKTPQILREWIIASDSAREPKWHLVRLEPRDASTGEWDKPA
jgi:4-amino-4-deoxy-L-arabinose transferase-like glycosyltransferase